MLALFYAILFQTVVLSLRKDGIYGREGYLRWINVVPEITADVPPNDVEVWYGYRRIYMGEDVFRDIRHLKPSFMFQAPSNRLSTLVQKTHEEGLVQSFYSKFLWLRVNIPGGDVSRGEDVIPRNPSTDSEAGRRLILVFPQNNKVNIKSAKQTFTPLDRYNVSDLVTALQLNPADAVSVYTIWGAKCGGDEYRVSEAYTPDWDHLRPNMYKATQSEVFLTPPRGVVEVEYVEGVSLRMGNCLALFMVHSAPASVKYATTPSSYYTLCFVRYAASYSCKWLLVNIPGADISNGVEVVPYSPPTSAGQAYAPCVFVLFSQGKSQIAVSEINQVPSLTPKAISDKFKLGDPVAANYFRSYTVDGVPPGKHPSIRPTGSPTFSPVWNQSPTRDMSPKTGLTGVVTIVPPDSSTHSPAWNRSSTRGVSPKTGAVTSVVPTTTGSTSMLLNGRVYVSVTAFLMAFRIGIHVD